MAADLAATPLIVRERGSGTRAALEGVLGTDQMTEPLVELASNAAVKVLVETGAGPAVLSVSPPPVRSATGVWSLSRLTAWTSAASCVRSGAAVRD